MRELIARILSRPVGVLVAASAVVVMGVLSFRNIPVQMLPSGFEERHITVRASLRDSSPEEAERHVAIPIEEALGTVAGIESVNSRCDRNRVRVSLELKKDAVPTEVERDVRDRIARVEADMPDDVNRIRIRREGMNDRPVAFFACIAKADRVDLSDFMEDVIIPRLESLDGVARADAWGLLKRAVRIQLDPEEVKRRNLDLRELLRRLRGDNLSSDVGDVRDGGRKAYLRASMEFDSLEEIREFPVMQGLKLGDLATVEIRPSLDEAWSRYNANAVIVGTVYKTAGANTVEVSHRIRALFDDLVESHAEFEELDLLPFFDEGAEIENSLKTLYKNAVYGGILAIGILFAFFRRFRMTLLVAAALPLSLTVAITIHYLGGGSLNVLSMMGLTIAVGMLIDNAIVVVESILRRRETGELPKAAAAGGTGEVALAIVTATLTTIVVFLPAILLSGDTNARLFLVALGGPIAFALLASLAVALILVPLGSIYLRRRKDKAQAGRGGALGGAHPRYARVLRTALRHRFAVVALGVVVFVSMFFPAGQLSRKGAMSHGGGPVRVFLRFPRHFELRDANAAVRRYEEYVLEVKEELEIEGIYARFDHRGGMVMIWRSHESEKERDEVRDAIREGWPKIPGIWTSLESSGMEGKTKVVLEGEDAGELDRTMEIIEERLKRLPSVAETQREREAGLQELRVMVDPEALERGQVVPQLIRAMIGWVLRGARLRDYRSSDGRDLPVLLELDPDQIPDVADLGALLIPTDQGFKPLGILSRMAIHNAPSRIERRDGRRVAELEVLGREEDEFRFSEEVKRTLEQVPMPPGVRFKIGGSWRELEENFADLTKALALGGVFVFLLTGILFEALLLPLAVICAVFPALAGGIWALYIAGKPLDELAMLGGILLVGVVVNNGIVLIDRVQQWRREGLPLRPAVLAAGRDRLRPVVMTAVTTIGGLLPMAIIKGPEDRIPYDTLATVVIGGLVVSTLVTLILVPVAFTLFHDLGRVLSGILRRAASLPGADSAV